MNKIKLIVGVIVFTILFVSVSFNYFLFKERKSDKEKNAQYSSIIDSLRKEKKNYVEIISDFREFTAKMDSTTKAILKLQQIKPKWVNELIQTHYYYINHDTTITQATPTINPGVYNWEIKEKCIETKGYVVVGDSLPKVAITNQLVNVDITGVKYTRREKTFKMLGLKIFRYGPKEVLITTKAGCGEAQTTITQIEK